jgi:YesN/AraC family two-component response regulator
MLKGADTGLDLWEIFSELKLPAKFILLSGADAANFYERTSPYEVIPHFMEKPLTASKLIEQMKNVVFNW